MDFVILLFMVILPFAALCVSMYSLFHILSLKKAAMKLSALHRLAGKDVTNE